MVPYHVPISATPKQMLQNWCLRNRGPEINRANDWVGTDTFREGRAAGGSRVSDPWPMTKATGLT